MSLPFNVWFEQSVESISDQDFHVKSGENIRWADVLEDKFQECLKNGFVKPSGNKHSLRIGFTHVDKDGKSTTYLAKMSVVKGSICKDSSRSKEIQTPLEQIKKTAKEGDKMKQIIDEIVRQDKKKDQV